jgi:cytidylate kinase
VARPEDRAKAVSERLGLSPDEAADWVEKTEAERVRFIKRTFKFDPRDAGHYDLVLNTSRLTVEEAADLITETLRRLQRHARPEAKRAASLVLN